MNELEALQNAASNVPGLTVRQWHSADRRKTKGLYVACLESHVTPEGFVRVYTVSPALDYTNINHFILGFIRGFNLANHAAKDN